MSHYLDIDAGLGALRELRGDAGYNVGAVSAVPELETSVPADPSPLLRMLAGIEALTSITGNPELQAQTMRVFLLVASRHPSPISMGEVEKTLSLTQTSCSRNLGYLSKGNARMPVGYGLIKVEEDPFYRKRKMCSLSSEGVQAVVRLYGAFSKILQRHPRNANGQPAEGSV